MVLVINHGNAATNSLPKPPGTSVLYDGPANTLYLAADGVSDLLSSIATLSATDHPDPIFAGLRGNGETLQLHATDVGAGAVGQWLVRRTPVGVVDQEDLARLVERLQTAAQPGQDGGHVAPDERRGLQQPRQRNGGRIAVVEAGAAGVAGVRRRRYVARLTELHHYVKTQK